MTNLPNLQGPKVIGYGKGTFSIGELIHQDNFTNLDNWVIQIEKKEADLKPEIIIENNTLELFTPLRGCSAWFKNKLKGPITIVYKVICPTSRLCGTDVAVRDINNFWHCQAPLGFDSVLKDPRFDGKFPSYSPMNGYYASTGGGGKVANRTTRFRLYPRVVDGEDVPHIALQDKDENEKYLITPDFEHTIQLVACDDIAQYIVDGEIVYQIKSGDRVSVGLQTPDGMKFSEEIYNSDNFPIYTKGYFGFRMTTCHHIYSDFKVYRLDV